MKTACVGLGALVAVVVFFLSSTPLEAFNLPDSDQRECYQAVYPYAEIPCLGSGQDGEHVRNPLNYADNGYGMVIDNHTGLMWQQEDSSVTPNWYVASGTYDGTYNPDTESTCGSLTLGGYSDWRLPSRKELLSIVDFAILSPGPTISTEYFPNAKTLDYWSSTPVADIPDSAWYVGFYDSWVDYRGKGIGGYVRCVRGEQVDLSFSDRGDGTVAESRTGLIWQQGEPGAMTWGAALTYCGELALAGATNWRLPNIKELESLSDDMRDHPSIDTVFFPGASASGYWSATTYAGLPSKTWALDFNRGNDGANPKSFSENVRCVRGGSVTFPPEAANKTSPANWVTGQPTSLMLTWGTSTDADSYQYCYDTSNDGACSNWQSTTDVSAGISGLAASTTYYWQVRAVNGIGVTEADGGAWWQFSTAAPDHDPLIFSDDFSGGSSTEDPDWEEVAGGWKVNAAGSFVSAALKGNRALVQGVPPLDSFGTGVIETKVKLPRWAVRAPNGGVLFHVFDASNYRYVTLKRAPSGGKLVIGQKGDPAGDGSGSFSRSVRLTLYPGRVYTLRVNLWGNRLAEAFLGGTRVFEWTFPQVVPGRVGLVAARSKTVFDDFRIYDSSALQP